MNLLKISVFCAVLAPSMGLFAQQVEHTSQEINNPSINGPFTYEITFQGIGENADDATIKRVQSISKPFFEEHPRFNAGVFTITTDFYVDENRIPQLYLEQGFTITDLKVSQDDTISPIKNSQL